MPKRHEIAVLGPSAFDAVLQAIKKGVTKGGATPVSTDGPVSSGDGLKTVQDVIKRSTAVVAYIIDSNSDMMFAIALAQALGKPIIPVANNFTDIPKDLESVEFVLLTNFVSEDDFISKIASVVGNVLKNPDKYSYEIAIEARSKKQNVFISYSHSDREYLDRMLVHLAPLKKQGLLDLWVDTHLRAGDKWKSEIESALYRATVAILVVSADFLASDFIVENELPPLLRSAEERGVRIIPLIAKPCRFTRDHNLKHFQSINDPKDALVLLDSGQREKIFDALCAEVERYVK